MKEAKRSVSCSIEIWVMFPQPPCHCVLLLFTFVQLVHQSQVLGGKREVPNLEILLLSLSLARLWQKSNPLLQAPAQEHLSRRDCKPCSYGGDCWLLQQRQHPSTQAGICLKYNPVLPTDSSDLSGRKVGVAFVLNHSRSGKVVLCAVRQQLLELPGREIAHTKGRHTFWYMFCHQAIRFQSHRWGPVKWGHAGRIFRLHLLGPFHAHLDRGVVEVPAWSWPVHQPEIELSNPKKFQRFSEPGVTPWLLSLWVDPRVTPPQLGLHKQVLSPHSACSNCFPNLFLIVIAGCCVNALVTLLQC